MDKLDSVNAFCNLVDFDSAVKVARGVIETANRAPALSVNIDVIVVSSDLVRHDMSSFYIIRIL